MPPTRKASSTKRRSAGSPPTTTGVGAASRPFTSAEIPTCSPGSCATGSPANRHKWTSCRFTCERRRAEGWGAARLRLGEVRPQGGKLLDLCPRLLDVDVEPGQHLD